jgi:hypothetical protein
MIDDYPLNIFLAKGYISGISNFRYVSADYHDVIESTSVDQKDRSDLITHTSLGLGFQDRSPLIRQGQHYLARGRVGS